LKFQCLSDKFMWLKYIYIWIIFLYVWDYINDKIPFRKYCLYFHLSILKILFIFSIIISNWYIMKNYFFNKFIIFYHKHTKRKGTSRWNKNNTWYFTKVYSNQYCSTLLSNLLSSLTRDYIIIEICNNIQ